ncbi:hypothetical protein GV792_04920 [Nocardia cyriacigeorgica]|uniref:hypothetical protein n=1 Tax=Nocardia cyriacigeorgica TaxID=135487 RepID=UPI0013B77399|nr:hypothetical protein [Nocardia cyriacigeorgica]NEW49386.1 hypothetical protein [Nocardia cyriacigeorgica]
MIALVLAGGWACAQLIALPYIVRFFGRDIEALDVVGDFALIGLCIFAAILTGIALTSGAPA